MTIRETWKTALAASLIVSLAVAAVEHFVFGGGAVYIDRVDWMKVDTMPYGQARVYLDERVGTISNFESVMNGTAYEAFWLEFVYKASIYFALTFAGCLLFVKLKRSGRASKSGAPTRGLQ